MKQQQQPERLFPLMLRGHKNPLTYRQARKVANETLISQTTTELERRQAWLILRECARARAADEI